jgi:anaerobic magnesium-protoporphyrin IX monomethyl ester cyclase
MTKGKVLFVLKWFIIEPLGIGLLSAGLKKKGFEVDLLQIEEGVDVLSYVREYKPNIICFNIWTGSQQYFYSLNRHLKLNCNFVSIFGGAHATFCTDDVIKQKGIDYVVKGEGDTMLPELCDDIRRGFHFGDSRVERVGTTGALLLNVKTPPQNLDELPRPDRELLYKYEHNRNNPIRSIMASRGCPYACTFCFNSQFNELFEGKRLRFRSMKEIIREAIDIRMTYPETKYFFFQDDELGARKKELIYLADNWAYVGVPFHAQLRVEYIDHTRIGLLKEAGCNSVTFAIESANESTRKDILGKRFSDETIARAIKVLKHYGMRYRVENMIGIPFCDTMKDMWDTFQLNKSLGTTLSWASLCQPYPSTELGNRCVKEGIYDNDIDSIPEAFFGKTVLLFPVEQKRKLENMQRLFTLLVGLKVPKWLANILIGLPLPRLYERIGKWYKERCFKRLYDL